MPHLTPVAPGQLDGLPSDAVGLVFTLDAGNVADGTAHWSSEAISSGA